MNGPMTLVLENGFDAVVHHWGAHHSARRVTFHDRSRIRSVRNVLASGGTVILTECPRVDGSTRRKIVERGGRFYTRMLPAGD